MAVDRAAFADTIRRPDGDINLALAALQIAEIVEPVVQPATYLARLDQDADWLRVRVDPAADVEQAVRRLAHLLAVDRGLHGDQQTYDDPRNSCLNHVLDRRIGLPITLSVIYLEVGWRVGLPLAGVGMPGHFLIKAYSGDAEIIVDPFHGGAILAPQACADLVFRASGGTLVLEPHHLAAVTRRQILTRLLANLKHRYLRAPTADLPRAVATIELRLVVNPSSLDDVRDRGHLLGLLGETDAAVRDLETYIEYAHEAADVDQVRHRLAGLRRRLTPGF